MSCLVSENAETQIPDTVPKVLIVAPNASTLLGGEAALPLKYFEILRRRGHAPILVTHARNRPDLADHITGHDDIRFIEDTLAHRLLWMVGRRMPQVLQGSLLPTLMGVLDARAQSALVRKVLQERPVELIHQPTPVSPMTPSRLHRFGVPLVIGPMNGGMNYPPGYEDLEGRVARRFIVLGRRLARLVNRLTPGKRKAAILLVANERTRAALPFPDHRDIRFMVENGVDLSVWNAPEPPDDGPASTTGRDARDTPFRLAFVGRLIELKLVDVTLEAVALARADGADVTLDVFGDGPDRARLEGVTRALALDGHVTFHGFLPQADCARSLRMLSSDRALILNSGRECGGAVILEAMALGLPVIASDWGGPADYVDPECGILVSPVTRETFARRLADAILTLAKDPDLRHRMGAHGKHKVSTQFDWERKIDEICVTYRDAIRASGGTRPSA